MTATPITESPSRNAIPPLAFTATEGVEGAAQTPAAPLKLRAGFYDQEPDFGPGAPPRLHQSIAHLLVSRSPLHGYYKAFCEAPEGEFNKARNLGSICHAMMLGGKRIVGVDADDWRTKVAREARDAALAANKLPILVADLKIAASMCEGVTASLKNRGIVFDGRSELTAIWKTGGGIWCQGRLDHLKVPKPRTRKTNQARHIYDLKFVRSATKRICEAHFIEHGYDIQAAAYTQAVETIYPKLAGRVEMLFIFVESEPPHAVRVMPLAGSMKTSGLWRWGKACDIWRDCLKRGTTAPWPSYADDGEPAECPAWALNSQIVAEQEEMGGTL